MERMSSLEEMLQPDAIQCIDGKFWVTFRLQLWDMKKGQAKLYKNHKGQIIEVTIVKQPEGKAPIVEEPVKPEKKKIPKSRLFKKSDFLIEIDGVCLWQPVLNYIVAGLPQGIFRMGYIRKKIRLFYEEKLGRELTRGSGETYARAYRKYMLDAKLILEYEDGQYQLINPRIRNQIQENREFLSEVCE